MCRLTTYLRSSIMYKSKIKKNKRGKEGIGLLLKKQKEILLGNTNSLGKLLMK